MSRDFSLHVVHASITYFDGISVANFVKSVGLWEGLSYDCQKLFTYIRFNVLGEGWVKPCNFSIAILLPGGLISGIGIKF